jgi:hypothetical protein
MEFHGIEIPLNWEVFMDLSSIPRTFWHAASIAILVVTCGLVVIAYRSTSVSIEIAHTKIDLSHAINETEDLSRTLQAENQRLKQAQAELQAKVVALQGVLSRKKPQDLTAKDLEPLDANRLNMQQVIVPDERFQQVQQNLKELRQAVKD